LRAGDNPELMVAPSAYLDSILTISCFIKIIVNSVEVFEYSNDDSQGELLFGLVQLAIKLRLEKNASTINRLYEYRTYQRYSAGYEPIIQLVSPTKFKSPFWGVIGPSEKSAVNFEIESVIMTKSFFRIVTMAITKD
jgi:hypothetical protein